MPAHRTWPREVACPWRTPWCWPMFSARRTASRRHSGRTSEGAGPEPTGSRSRVAPRHGAGSCHPPSVTPRCANEETRCSATATDRSSRLPEAALPALHHHVDLFRPHIVTAVAEFKKIRTTRPVRFRLKPSFDSGDLNGSSCPEADPLTIPTPWRGSPHRRRIMSGLAGSARCLRAVPAMGASTPHNRTRWAQGNSGRRSSQLRCRMSSGCDHLPRTG